MFCNVCKQDLAVGDFYSGLPSRCKDCHKRAMKLNRLTNPKVQERERERAKTPERRAYTAGVGKRWRAKHPEAYRAHNAVNNAVRDGKLGKLPCAICGNPKSHAHHTDYSKPLEVKWLCAQCHQRIHVTFPELGGHHNINQ